MSADFSEAHLWLMASPVLTWSYSLCVFLGPNLLLTSHIGLGPISDLIFTLIIFLKSVQIHSHSGVRSGEGRT